MQIWKTIEGYTGLYEVSDRGVIRSITHDVMQVNVHGSLMKRTYLGKELKPRKAKNGYYYVHLSRGGLRKTVKNHRMVAETFLPNPDNKPCVNHIDGNKLNNSVNNLEWVTYLENSEHAWENKLILSPPTGEKSYNYKGAIAVIDNSGQVVDVLVGFKDMKDKGYNQSSIWCVMNGRHKKHKGFTFKYLKEIDNEC